MMVMLVTKAAPAGKAVSVWGGAKKKSEVDQVSSVASA